MAIRFPGARMLAERRRRRLAANAESESGHGMLVVQSQLPASGPPVTTAVSEPLPISTMVPRSWWAMLAIAVAGGMLVAGVLLATWYEAECVAVVGSSHRLLFSSGTPRVVHWLGSVLLLLAGQLAWLIGLARGRSLTDFSGRYRIWSRVAIVLMTLALLNGTGAQEAISQLLVARFGFDGVWQREILCWLVPLLGLSVALLFILDDEFRTCRPARCLVWLTAVVFTGGMVLLIDPSSGGLESTQSLLARLSLVLGGQSLLALALLVHLRHVVHVSPEPPPLRFVRRRRKAEPAIDEDDSEPVAEPVAEPDEEVDEPVAAPSLDERPDMRIDEAHDPDPTDPDPPLLRGLSKRERRRLRKAWKEQQRQGLFTE